MKKLIMVLIIAVMAVIILPQAALAVNPRVYLAECNSDITFKMDGNKRFCTYTGADGKPHSIPYADGEAVEIYKGDGTPWEYSIIIQTGDHTVKLENMKIKGANPSIIVKSRAELHMTLVLNKVIELTATGSGSDGLRVEADAKLTIDGEGKMTVIGGDRGTGIGGDWGAGIGGGDITIGGGEIIATGGGNGAGIGGGRGGDSGKIIINDGKITATGGTYGAGIGGGIGGSGDVTINGGKITAMGGHNAAGIGGGDEGNGKVIISGGTITATGSNLAAGIGGGDEGDGNVSISGGTITATGGNEGAGIGGGYEGDGNVSITRGTIIATGGSNYGAGIGGGNGGDGNVSISGGTITATGGNEGAGIGGGNGGNGVVAINGGTITAMGGIDATGIGKGSDGDVNNVTTTGMSMYSGTAAIETNKLESYTGQSPVYMTDGKTNNTTEDLPDAEGNSGTVGAGTEGGTTDISQLDGNQAQSIAAQAGGLYVAGANISTQGGGNITGVGFAVSNATLGSVSGGFPIIGYVIVHGMSGGKLEMLPVSIKKQGNITIISTAKTPSGASPFVLVMRVGEPPAPPKTGDNNQPLIWLSLLLICGVGLTTLAMRTRKRRG